MTVVECWAAGKLMARHECSAELLAPEILKRFGISERFTVVIYPDGRPDQMRTIQEERRP